ncbi:MAG: DUF3106 domain-containing protein [Lautropia sp.]
MNGSSSRLSRRHRIAVALAIVPVFALLLATSSRHAVSAEEAVTRPGPGEDSAPVPVTAAGGTPAAPAAASGQPSAVPSAAATGPVGAPATRTLAPATRTIAPAVPAIVAPPRATPRPSLATRLEPLWVDLTPEQQQALAPFAPEWNTWPATEKKAWIALADKLPGMSADKRGRAQRRILEWSNLSPAQRQLARENYRLAKDRPVEQRVSEWRNYQSLTQDQQAVLRNAGRTSNTAAGHAGASTGLAKEASQPLPRVEPARLRDWLPAGGAAGRAAGSVAPAAPPR